jgi:hypothetical protein
MVSFLLQPYPFSENVRRKLAVCGGIGLFIILFLLLFQPFGFGELSTADKWKHALLFGAVTFIISSFFQIIPPRIFPRLFREEGWRSWKEIVYLLITTAFIGAGNYWLILLLYPQNESLGGFLNAQLITLQIGIFPILFVVFMKQMQLFRRYTATAKEVSHELHHEEETPIPLPVTGQKITLQGEGQKEQLTLAPADSLLFIASADNYVNVKYMLDGVLQSTLIRSTLKKMEEQLASHPAFFRCHRMYMVNLQQVTRISGNAQGLKLHLTGTDELIPVSRNLTTTIKDRLHHLSHSPKQA